MRAYRKPQKLNPETAGRTRVRLAALLNAAIPTARFAPEDLIRNDPYHASQHFDGCSWSADCRTETGQYIHIASWNRMGDLVKQGVAVFEVGSRDGTEYEATTER